MDEHIHDEGGATAVEYGLLVALIAGVIIAVVITFGVATGSAFQSVCDGISPFSC
jgi:pilus assembly protein Flp/PilA